MMNLKKRLMSLFAVLLAVMCTTTAFATSEMIMEYNNELTVYSAVLQENLMLFSDPGFTGLVSLKKGDVLIIVDDVDYDESSNDFSMVLYKGQIAYTRKTAYITKKKTTIYPVMDASYKSFGYAKAAVKVYNKPIGTKGRKAIGVIRKNCVSVLAGKSKKKNEFAIAYGNTTGYVSTKSIASISLKTLQSYYSSGEDVDTNVTTATNQNIKSIVIAQETTDPLMPGEFVEINVFVDSTNANYLDDLKLVLSIPSVGKVTGPYQVEGYTRFRISELAPGVYSDITVQTKDGKVKSNTISIDVVT